jgi:hypothetical protein
MILSFQKYFNKLVVKIYDNSVSTVKTAVFDFFSLSNQKLKKVKPSVD